MIGAIALILALTTTAAAQPKITLAPPKDGRIDFLTPVMAQSARCAAISDVHGMIAFGHDKDYADAHVSLVRLDAKGLPLAYASNIRLASPAALAKFPNYVTGVAFHPKLPLLYVWQDNTHYYTNPPPPPPPEMNQFDHLHIFNIAKETPELVLSLCRGLEFIYGQQGGAVGVDPTGSFLFVPNLRELKNAGSLRLGRFPLDADGLPLLLSEKETTDPLPVRIKKLTDLNVAGKVSPPALTPIEYVHFFGVNTYGSGHTFVPLNKDVVMSSTYQGLLTWRPDDKVATLHGLPLRIAGHTLFVVHPTLPAIFATSHYHAPTDSFFRAEHSEGYLSLLPKQYLIEGSKLTSPPAILSKHGKLALGGQTLVYLVDLDQKGFPTGNVIQTRINCPSVRALVYSEKHDRLYVGVELSK